MNAVAIRLALARHFDPSRNLMLFEAPVQTRITRLRDELFDSPAITYLADLLVITPSDYAMEVEIKVTLGDWRADAHKDKWTYGLPDWISKFSYAVPARLGIPPWVHPRAGVLHLHADGFGGIHAIVARAPTRIGRSKVPADVKQYILNRTYVRYWEYQFTRLSILVAGGGRKVDLDDAAAA